MFIFEPNYIVDNAQLNFIAHPVAYTWMNFLLRRKEFTEAYGTSLYVVPTFLVPILDTNATLLGSARFRGELGAPISTLCLNTTRANTTHDALILHT